MRLKAEQLPAALQKQLKPVYLISGDEPLQLGEAADAVRQAARDAGYGVRELIAIETGNEWPLFSLEADSTSIFADRKLLDLRLPSGKPGQEGGKALLDYCKKPPEDSLLLISAGKIESAAQKSQWFQAIDEIGVVIQVWPLQGSELQGWLQRRAERKGMHLDNDAARGLALRIEGNLLAAAQEIEKLFILYGPNRLGTSEIEHAVADSSRFDVFKLMDSLLSGKLNRSIRIIQGLRAEGTASAVVLWAISREIRSLSQLKFAQHHGENLEALYKKLQIWEQRRPLFREALARLPDQRLLQLLADCAQADRQIKGQAAGDEWESLFQLCLNLCQAASK